MTIECPLNGQYHDRRDVILTSRMAVGNNFITVTVIFFYQSTALPPSHHGWMTVIQKIQTCPVFEWCPVLKWFTSLDHFIYKHNFLIICKMVLAKLAILVRILSGQDYLKTGLFSFKNRKSKTSGLLKVSGF